MSSLINKSRPGHFELYWLSFQATFWSQKLRWFVRYWFLTWSLSLLLLYFIPEGKHVSVQLSHSVVSDCLWPHGLQHARLPCPLPTPRACSNSSPSSQWCHPIISVIPFSSCLQSFPIPGSFPMSQFFASGGQSIGVSASASASFLPVNIQDWFPLGLTDLLTVEETLKSLLQHQELVLEKTTTVQKDQFFGAQLYLDK